MKKHLLKKYLLPHNLVLYGLALLIGFGLKYHYSHADTDDLIWILAPTAALVEIVLPVNFQLDKGMGYICPERNITIAPACAGVNFMIITFCMAAFCGIHRLKHKTEKYLWIFLSLTGAFAITLAVNTLRIILSIHLYESGYNVGWFTPSRMHLAMGVIIYLFCLYGTYFSAQLILRKYQIPFKKKKDKQVINPLWQYAKKSNLKILIPLLWYLFITLGIPLLNGGYKKSITHFWEYASMVIIVCIVISLGFFCFRLFYMKLKDKIAIHILSGLSILLYPDNSDKF